MAYIKTTSTHPNHDDPWWIEPVDTYYLEVNPNLKGWYFVAHDDYGGVHAYFSLKSQAEQYVTLMRMNKLDLPTD